MRRQREGSSGVALLEVRVVVPEHLPCRVDLRCTPSRCGLARDTPRLTDRDAGRGDFARGIELRVVAPLDRLVRTVDLGVVLEQEAECADWCGLGTERDEPPIVHIDGALRPE